MKNVFLHITFALLLAVGVNTYAAGNLKLELSADKTSFLPGEPVVVLIKVTNTGDSAMYIPGGLEPEYDALIYEITGPDGNTRPLSPLYVSDTDKRIMLNKNESAYSGARIFFGGEGYYFSKPGAYKVMAHYKTWKSNTLSLTVSSPEDEAQKEQARLMLDNREVGLFMMLEGGDELRQAHTILETMIQKFPQSLLTDYLRYAQAKNLSVPARNFVSQQPRDADLTGAIKMLEALKNPRMLMYYRVKTATTLSEALQKSGRGEEARKVLESLQQTLKEQPRLAPYYNDTVESRLQGLQ